MFGSFFIVKILFRVFPAGVWCVFLEIESSQGSFLAVGGVKSPCIRDAGIAIESRRGAYKASD